MGLQLFSNIRFYILLFSFLLSLIEYWYAAGVAPNQFDRISLLVTIYAYTAVLYLYIALLCGPLTKIFQQLPFRPQYVKARRALGVSAFYFAILHAWNAFFNLLGGFQIVPLLDPEYQVALLLSTTALFILSLMAATSFDYMVKKLTFPVWKKLHQFVYIAAFFIVLHVMLIGSTFEGYFFIRVLFFVGVVILVGLHAVGLWKKHKLENPQP